VVDILKFHNGVYGTLHFSLNIPTGNDPYEVHGTKGSLFGDTTSPWWGEPKGELLLKGLHGSTSFHFKETDSYKNEIEDFNMSILEDREPMATGVDGLKAMEIAIAMFESARDGKAVRIGS
jgi:predicted dehydrogenase